MAKNRKPRKSYQRPDFRAEAARLNPEKYDPDKIGPVPEKGSEDAAHFNRVWGNVEMPKDTVRFTDPPAPAAAPRKPRAARPKPPVPKAVPVNKEPPAPAHPHVVGPTTPRAPRGPGRYLVPVAAGAGIIGGGAFLANRARRRKAAMAKALVNPLTGDGVVFEKRYLEDDIDEAPRGVLVAKAVKFTGVRGMRGVEFKQRARDKIGSKNVTRLRRAARAPKDFLREYQDTSIEGRFARNMHSARSGKLGIAGRTGALAQASGAGALGVYGIGHASGRHDAEGNKRMGPADRRAARAKATNASKRYDESALEHTGSRRVGGRLPVSSVRTAGLPVQSATFSRGNAEARPGTRSHANRLTHVHTNVKAPRTGKLYQLHHRSRSKSGTSIGKSAGYAQSAGNGRRLVNV